MRCHRGLCLQQGTHAEAATPTHTKVYLGAQSLSTLLYSGSAVSMVRSHLVPADLPVIRWFNVVCLHHHTRRLPVVALRVTYLGRTNHLEVVRVDELPFPILLRRGAPDFSWLLMMASPEDVMVALPVDEEDPGEGPSTVGEPGNEGKPGDPVMGEDDLPSIPSDETFHLAQE